MSSLGLVLKVKLFNYSIKIIIILFCACTFADNDGVYTLKLNDLSYSDLQTNDINDIINSKVWLEYNKNKSKIIYDSTPRWFKFQGDRLFAERLYISLKNPLLDSVKMYVVQDSSVINYFSWGDHEEDLNYKGGYHKYVTVDPLKEITYYAQITNTSLLYLAFEVADEFSFQDGMFQYNLVMGMFAGALTLLLLYGFVMMFIVRSWLHLQFLLFSVGVFLLNSYQYGFFVNILSHYDGVHDILHPLILSYIVITGLIFIMNYTKIKQYSLKIYYLMLVSLVLPVFALITFPFFDIKVLYFLNLINYQIISVVLIFTSIYLMFVKKTIGGIFLALNLIVFIPGNYLHTLTMMGYIEVPFSPRYFFVVSHIYGLFIWAVALGYEIYFMKNIIHKQKYELHHNELTKVYNRAGVVYEVKKMIKHKDLNDVSIAMIDIDHFKKVNDNHGHNVGDQVLKYFADFIKVYIRDYDVLGRWGGEEFLLILPNTNLVQTQDILNRILNDMNKNPYQRDAMKIKISYSAGISYYKVDENQEFDFDKMVDIADKNLYFAKNNGRNRVCI